MKNFVRAITVLVSAASMSPIFAVEMNGLQVNVYKRTSGKKEVKTEYYSGIDKSMTLAISIKNISLRKMPEGELRWNIFVKKGYGYVNVTEKMSGVELVKPLLPSETVEITVGPAKVGEYHSGKGSEYNYKEYKDRLDYEIIILQNEQELMRVGSDASFSKSTKPFTPATRVAALNGEKPNQNVDDGDVKAGNGAGENPKPVIATPKPIATAPKPTENKPLIGKEDPSPVVKASPPAVEYSATRPFDFFNLGGNGK